MSDDKEGFWTPVSALITLLQDAMVKHGDLPVEALFDAGYGGSIGPFGVYFNPDERRIILDLDGYSFAPKEWLETEA